MEYFDIVNEDGETTGKTVSREKAHRDGILHRTTHVWLVRKDGRGGYQILLQKRSREKDSYPGLYDTSSAGHIPAGDEPKASALRELKEELGMKRFSMAASSGITRLRRSMSIRNRWKQSA